MDESDRTIMRTLASCLFVVVGGCASCTCVINMQDDNAMVAMVKNGSDPISAHCAVKTMVSECSIIAAKVIR